MGKRIGPLALLFALVVVGCGEDVPAGAPGTGGSDGSGGVAGSGGSDGGGGSAGMGGSAGIGGAGGSAVEVCTDDGRCAPEDDCVCIECDDDLFCGDPDNCVTDGVCAEFSEGCVCPDCASLPVCER